MRLDCDLVSFAQRIVQYILPGVVKTKDKYRASFESYLMLMRSSFLHGMSHRRDSVIIVSEILSCAVKGIGKCEMLCKVGLSSAQLKKYLLFLLKSELLATWDEGQKPAFKTTAKGKNFLDTFDTITRLLD